MAQRRWLVVLLALAGLLAVASLANANPLRAYLGSRDRLEATQTHVEELERETAQAKKEVSALEDGSRVEVQARKDLSYVRPGEEMFIIEGLPDSTESVEAPQSVSGGDTSRALLDRVLDFLAGLF